MTALAFYLPHPMESINLWVNFIRETARSFDADCYLVGDEGARQYAKRGIQYAGAFDDLPGKKVLLDAAGGPLEEFDHSGVSTYVLGPDNFTVKFPGAMQRLAIPLPADYPLWSAVAAGICLYDRQQKLI